MYTAWCEYEATGEGRTIMISIGMTEDVATHNFSKDVNPYYHPGMQVQEGIPIDLIPFIPPYVLTQAQRGADQLCYWEWFGNFHMNCS